METGGTPTLRIKLQAFGVGMTFPVSRPTSKGVAGGFATLDASTGKLPTVQDPSPGAGGGGTAVLTVNTIPGPDVVLNAGSLADGGGKVMMTTAERLKIAQNTAALVGAFYNIKASGAVKGDGVTDDTAAIQAEINASPDGSTIVFPPGTYLVSNYIQAKAGRRYLGAGYSRAFGACIKQKAGANITATAGPVGLFVPPAWATNQTTCDGQILIENLAFDGNRTNNGSSTLSGIILMNFWTQVRDCYIVDMPRDSILQTDVTINGTNVITNSASECDIFNNKMNGNGWNGFRQVSQNSNSNLDGNFKDNRISYMGRGAITMSRGAGWTIDNNHTYGIVGTAIDVSGCFATSIINNYIEDFGGEAITGEYYAGIRTSSLNGRGLVISGNKIFGQELGANSTYHYILVNANSGQTQCEAVISGNTVAGGNTAGDSSHQRIGIVVQHSSGGFMTAYGSANIIRRVATQRYVAGGDVYLEGPQDAVPAARKYKTGTQTPAANNVVPVTFDITQYNRNTDYFDLGTANVITILKDGFYAIDACLNFTSGTAGDRTGIITVNGTGVREFGLPGTASRPYGAINIPLAANDVVGVSVYTVGGAVIDGSASKDCALTVVRIGN